MVAGQNLLCGWGPHWRRSGPYPERASENDYSGLPDNRTDALIACRFTSPAANTAIASTNELKLTFSEALVAQFSGMSVLMTGMPGMKMTAPMSVGSVTSTVAADGKTLVGTLKSPLPADTHRAEGSYSFTVK